MRKLAFALIAACGPTSQVVNNVRPAPREITYSLAAGCDGERGVQLVRSHAHGASVATRSHDVVVTVPEGASPTQLAADIDRTSRIEMHVIDDTAANELATRIGSVPGATSEIQGAWLDPDGRRHDSRTIVTTDRDALVRQAPAGRELAFARHGAAWESYVIEPAPLLVATDVADAIIGFDPTTQRPEVVIELTARGSAALAEASANHVGDRIATIVDGEVVAAAVITAPLTTGKVAISAAGGPEAEATAHAIVAALHPCELHGATLVGSR
jgi:preprotein translocase subunit SecD